MTELTAPTPAATPAEPYEVENTTRASERFTDVLPATYDEKDDMDLLKEQLKRRKKPIYAGLAFLCVVVIGVSIAVTSGGDATKVNTGTGVSETPAPTTSAPTVDDSGAGGVHGADLTPSTTPPTSSTGSAANEAGELDADQIATNTSSPSSTTPAPTTEAPTPAPTDGPILPYKAVDFNWKDTSNWQYSSGAGIPGGMFSDDGIKLTSANSPQPIRTKMGWGGEKIVLFEWERSDSSDTNIWMLNTKIREQFGANNGWPRNGEIDIFEMFTQDKALHPAYDFSGFMGFSNVASYGQLTLHYGPDKDHPCFCPASPSKSSWYSGGAPMTSGCTAQFANTPKNSIATIWGSDGNGKYLQLYQNPKVTKGGKINGQQTYDIQPGGVVTPKIYNNANLFWGTPASAACAAGGGHNPATGFPFFEEFYITMEEQKKNDGSAWFKVNNIQIFRK